MSIKSFPLFLSNIFFTICKENILKENICLRWFVSEKHPELYARRIKSPDSHHYYCFSDKLARVKVQSSVLWSNEFSQYLTGLCTWEEQLNTKVKLCCALSACGSPDNYSVNRIVVYNKSEAVNLSSFDLIKGYTRTRPFILYMLQN